MSFLKFCHGFREKVIRGTVPDDAKRSGRKVAHLFGGRALHYCSAFLSLITTRVEGEANEFFARMFEVTSQLSAAIVDVLVPVNYQRKNSSGFGSGKVHGLIFLVKQVIETPDA